MSDPRVEIEPGGDELLRRAGIDDPRALLTFTGGRLVNSHATREVRAVDAGDEALYVKRQTNRTARRERDALRRVAAMGVDAATPVALVEGGGASVLVTRGIPGGRPLDEALRGLSPTARRRIVVRVAELVATLHRGGFAFPDLFAKHVILDDRDRPRLIDLERLRRGASTRRRARDLAALWLTTELGGGRATDAVAFLRAYLGESPLGSGARRLARAVARSRRRLARRRRYLRHRLTVRGEHRDALEVAGLVEFGDYRESPVVRSVRRLSDRENVTVEAGGTTYFGKRVPASHVADAVMEWQTLVAFRREGLPGPSPAVLGTDPIDGGFVFTAAVPGRPVDDLLREGAVPLEEQRPLAREIGALVRRMHALGFWHRDLYLCHVFARREGAGWMLSIIDLARVGRRPRPRSRWFVKDLAALLHSIPPGTVRLAAIGEFLRAYLGGRRFEASDRKLVRRVRRKCRRIARHVPRWTPEDRDGAPERGTP